MSNELYVITKNVCSKIIGDVNYILPINKISECILIPGTKFLSEALLPPIGKVSLLKTIEFDGIFFSFVGKYRILRQYFLAYSQHFCHLILYFANTLLFGSN